VQVLKIMFGGSAEGISFLSVFLELLAISFSGVYSYASGFPFSAYGEAVFLAVQVAQRTRRHACCPAKHTVAFKETVPNPL
jgi:hypothetical protein